MPEFWRSSGYRLVAVDGEGRLRPTDDFLRAFLLRPEIVPVAESCAAELALHEALLETPSLAVPEQRLAGLADPDARDNYRVAARLSRPPARGAEPRGRLPRSGAPRRSPASRPCSSISWST